VEAGNSKDTTVPLKRQLVKFPLEETEEKEIGK
jgi:hypothetical protein